MYLTKYILTILYISMSKTYIKGIEELVKQFQIRGRDEIDADPIVLINQLLSRLNIFCDPTREFFKGAVRNANKHKRIQVRVDMEEDPRNFIPRSRLQVSYMIVWTLLHTFRKKIQNDTHR